MRRQKLGFEGRFDYAAIGTVAASPLRDEAKRWASAGQILISPRVGLDDQGTIVLREKLARSRSGGKCAVAGVDWSHNFLEPPLAASCRDRDLGEDPVPRAAPAPSAPPIPF
jgi:hypothetical protein